MKRWWLVMALMLSLGVNLGILVTRLLPPRETAPADRADAGSPEADRAGARPPEPLRRPTPGAPFQRRQLPLMVRRMADELGLEGERRDAFVAIQRRFFRQTVDARARLKRGQGRLRRELMSDPPDRAAVDETLEQLAAARADLERAFVDNLLESREILNPRQRRLFLRFIARLRRATERDRVPPPARDGTNLRGRSP